jgi:hypothetical protein
MDNLQSTTYDVFEKDPVKYERYEQAVYRALCDRPEGLETCVLNHDLKSQADVTGLQRDLRGRCWPRSSRHSMPKSDDPR